MSAPTTSGVFADGTAGGPRTAGDPEETRWAAWMCAAQRGDKPAYERLMRELETALRGFLRGQLAGSDLAEDCLQEALFAIHRARHTYDGSRPFKPWVFTVARYKCVDALRRAGTRRRHELPAPATDSDEDLPAQRASGTDTAVPGWQPAAPPPIDADRALRSLAAPFREAIVLTKLEGYTVEEAAARAGTSRAAMRSRVHRGLKQLRTHFGQALHAR